MMNAYLGSTDRCHEHPCDGGRLCLSHRNVCDGYTTCHDGSDEANCCKRSRVKVCIQ